MFVRQFRLDSFLLRKRAELRPASHCPLIFLLIRIVARCRFILIAMQYIKYILLSLLLGAASLSHLAGQNIWRNTTFVGGATLGEQDRRLFTYIFTEKLLAREPNKKDYGLSLYLEKQIIRYGPLQLDAGIGYAESNTLFGRPFSHIELNGPHTYEIRFIKRYTINKLILPISGKVYIGKFYLQFSAIPAICFRKSAMNIYAEKRVTRWQFNWNSLELNPGLGFQFSDRVQAVVSYRWRYFNEVDKVKWFSLTFYGHYNDEFLQQKVDTYNPFKMWLTVGYKWKK